MKICDKVSALLRQKEGQVGRVRDVFEAQHHREIDRRNRELAGKHFACG
jgi:hypothetical protein